MQNRLRIDLLIGLLLFASFCAYGQVVTPPVDNNVVRPGMDSWTYTFSTPQTCWTPEPTMPGVTVTAHQYNPLEGNNQPGCEMISFNTAQKTDIFWGMNIGTGLLTDETIPTVFFKSDHPGAIFYLRIILPAELLPNNQGPVTFLLEGNAYSNNGHWSQLRFDHPIEKLNRRVREVASQQGKVLNINGAYYDKIFINLYSGTQPTTVWIDDVIIGGYKGVNVNTPVNFNPGVRAPMIIRNTPPGIPGQSPSPATGLPERSVMTTIPSQGDLPYTLGATPAIPQNHSGFEIPFMTKDNDALGSGRNTPKIVIAGQGMLVNDSAIFLRAIRHRGEKMETIRNLGFNSVWMMYPPTPELQEECARLGLWIICPPPLGDIALQVAELPPEKTPESTPDRTNESTDTVEQESSDTNSTQDSLAINSQLYWGDNYPRVLAWDLGNITQRNLDSRKVNILFDLIKQADRDVLRPIICQTKTDLLKYSRMSNNIIMVAHQNPVYSTLDYPRYIQWLNEYSSLLVGGTPVWNMVTTQPDAQLVQQWQNMFPNKTYPVCLPEEQLNLAVFTTLSAGCRSLLFDSYTSLDETDIQTQNRCRSLEMINYKLSVIEAFLAAGEKTQIITTVEKDTNMFGIILTIKDRARLMIALSIPPDSQYVVQGRRPEKVKFCIPGIPTTYQVWRLTPNGLDPVNHWRESGGLVLQPEIMEGVSMYLLSKTPLVISSISKRMRSFGVRIAELKFELVKWRRDNFQQWIDLNRLTFSEKQLIQESNQFLAYSRAALNQRNYSAAYDLSARAAENIYLLEHAYWRKMISSTPVPNTHPAAVAFRLITLYHSWILNSLEYRQGDNLLPSGDFESLDTFQNAPWSHFPEPAMDAYVGAELSPDAAFSGTMGLRIVAWPKSKDMKNNPRMLERAPVTIYSPQIKVNPSETVIISMQVNIPTTITGSVNGLVICEMNSGECLQTRITNTRSWQRVKLFRTADKEGIIQLRFDLTGYGDVYIDNVTVRQMVKRQGHEASDVQD